MLEPRIRWQHIRLWLPALLIGSGVLVGLAALMYGVIRFGWDWTGFTGGASQVTVNGATEDTVYLPSKTLWDWMQLLLVPLILAVGGFWLNQLQKTREDRAAAQRDEVERKIAADNQREAALQLSIDKIGELLLHEQLGSSPGNPQVENIARARTVTFLRILDPVRRVSLLQFLSEAGILQICANKDNLAGIDLHETQLVQFDFSQLNLREANFCRANLSEANLRGARLIEAVLNEAVLNEAVLNEAVLIGANLSHAHLVEARLRNANLVRADLSGADLRNANLVGADLRNANLVGADLNEADLSEAKLNGADLRSAQGLTDEQRADYQSRGASVDPVPATPTHMSLDTYAGERGI